MPLAAFTDRFVRSLQTDKMREEYSDSVFSAGGTLALIVRSSGKKTFLHRYRINGKKKCVTLGIYPALSLADARIAALKNQVRVNKGEDPAAERKQERLAETFEEIAELFYERHVCEHLKEHTRKQYRGILDADLLPSWGDRKAAEIKRKDVIALLDKIANDRNSPIMANRSRAVMSKIFNFAISRDLIQANPVVGTERPGRENRGERVLSTAEIRELWTLLDGEHPVMAGIYKILILTGQRPGEVLSMKWSDIDKDVWTISSEVSKNRRVHRVHLTKQALDILENLQPYTAHKEFIFTMVANKPVSFIRSASRRLCAKMQRSAEEATGSSSPKWNPRDLRRTVQTRMAEIGIRPDIIDRVLNHNVRGVRAHYDHYNYYPEIRNALIEWGLKVDQIVNEQPSSNVVQIYN